VWVDHSSGQIYSWSEQRNVVEVVVDSKLPSMPLGQWFPTGEEFLPREEFHEFRGGISTLQ